MPNSIASKPRKARTPPHPSRLSDKGLSAATGGSAARARQAGGGWLAALVCGGLLLGNGLQAQESTPPLANRLVDHPSPYLAQHAADPVSWQLWDEATFARAVRERKLLLVSSGYFSCHWCHVMQRESFRDARIAATINRQFIPVKIDRETQPALDAALLDFARRSRGQAGWPLQVFVTPEGYPLAATTYLPPQAFLALLDDLAVRWEREAAALTATARAAAEHTSPTPPPERPLKHGALLPALRTAALAQADELQGGFGAQARFPHAPQLLALLQAYTREPHAELRAFLRLTLRQMATQGLHDELGGGFFRYTIDPDWQTPHFEKLLADNALLARVYLRAAQVFAEPEWRTVAQRTLDFILQALRAPGGGYYTALSAVDDAGVEGGYYLWSSSEVHRVAGARGFWLERYWGLAAQTPFAAGHLPIPRQSRAELAAELHLPLTTVEIGLESLYAQLRARRAQRSLPVDRQVLAGANGLLLSALAEASLHDNRYARPAAELMAFMRREFWRAGRLVRARSATAAPTPAALEDYAYVAEGLSSWYAATQAVPAETPLLRALVEQAWARYWVDGYWRLGEDALLRWGGRDLALADTALPAPPAVLMRVTRSLNADPPRSAAAEAAAWATVMAAAFQHASYLDVYP